MNLIELKKIIEDVMNESNTAHHALYEGASLSTFELDKSQYNQLSTILSKIGGDIDNVTVGDVDEARKKPNYMAMKSDEFVSGGHVKVGVSQDVIDGLEKLVESGDAPWMRQFH